MIGFLTEAKKRLESISTGTPAFSASFTYSFVHGTTGFFTTISTREKSSGRCCPRTKVIFFRIESFFTDDSSSSRFLISVTTISRAPSAARYRTVPTPPSFSPSPKTVTRFPLKEGLSIGLYEMKHLRPAAHVAGRCFTLSRNYQEKKPRFFLRMTSPKRDPFHAPSSTATFPFTTTYRMPSGYWKGSSMVAWSRTVAGSKIVISA